MIRRRRARAAGEVRSVLVYSMGEVIGDGLIKLPFLASLRDAFPGARISWCAAKGETVYGTVLKSVVAGALDEVIEEGRTGVAVSEFLLLQRPFGGRRFDVVIDTQTNVRRSLVIRRAAKLFVSPSLNFRVSDRRPSEPFPLALVERLQTLASLACGREVRPRAVSLADPRATEVAGRLLPEGPVYVGFAPGSGGVIKRWPLERYIALGRAQVASGRTPVFFIGPDEREMAERIRLEIPAALFPEETPGLELKGPLLVIALAGRLACAVANDAGPGHMFAAGGAPLVSLQGGRRRAAKFHPAASRLELLVAEDFGEMDVMEAIPESAAAAAIERICGEAGVTILIPVSAGELVDKITILRVKADRISPDKRANVEKELRLLEEVAEQALPTGLEPFIGELQEVNAALWDVEEGKRDCERRKDFGEAFVLLARRVYQENDRRAAIKRRINEAAGSELVEEKSYAAY